MTPQLFNYPVPSHSNPKINKWFNKVKRARNRDILPGIAVSYLPMYRYISPICYPYWLGGYFTLYGANARRAYVY